MLALRLLTQSPLATLPCIASITSATQPATLVDEEGIISPYPRSHDATLVIPNSRVNAFRYSLFINALFLWNSLPTEVVHCLSYNSFKFNLCKSTKLVRSPHAEEKNCPTPRPAYGLGNEDGELDELSPSGPWRCIA